VDVVATSAVIPGAPSNGVIVDRRFAEIAADNNLYTSVEQVWVRNGAAAAIESRLRNQGIRITLVQQEANIRWALGRQGPGLASELFIAEAGAAALLAAGGVILGIYMSSRRRRYELAALQATGLKPRTLLTALLAEQAIILAFGAIAGIAAGIAALAAVLRDVPEFVVTPTAPALSYLPPEGQLLAILGIVLGLAAAAMVLTSISLVRGVRLDQLREAPA
jgi:predicted lysophospholipase L1 biosynthesis ABC-type transport system permease subunit